MNEKKTVRYLSSVVLISVFVKLLGLARQIAVSSAFGMTGATDAFHLVSVTMNDLELILFSGLPVVYLTAYVQTKAKAGSRAADQLTTQILLVFLSVSLLAVLPFELFTRPMIRLMAPGLSPEPLEKAVLYLRILAAAIPLFCVRNLMSALFNAENEYWYEQSFGVIQSVCVIAAIAFLSKRYGIDALIPVLMLSYALEVTLGLFRAYQNGYYRFFPLESPWKPRSLWTPRVQGIVRAMLPLMLSTSLSALNALIDRAVSSALKEGTLTAIAYSQALSQFVISILISSTLTVLFTSFARDAGESGAAAFGEAIPRIAAAYAMILLPVSIVSIVCAEEIVSIVYQHGAVTAESVRVAAWALRGYGLGFLPLALHGVLLRAYYSISNTRDPFYSGLLCVLLNAVLTLLLSRIWGAFGVTIATSAGYVLSFCLLGAMAPRRLGGAIRWGTLRRFSLQAGAAACVSTLAACWIHSAIASAGQIDSIGQLSFAGQGRAVLALLAVIMVCFGSFFAILYLLDCGEFHMALKLLAGQFRNRRK